MDSKKCCKFRDIVRLQQVLKKWRKQAACNSNKQDTTITKESKKGHNSNKGIKFLKKTLSFSDTCASLANVSDHHLADIPKGRLAVCVGNEKKKRFLIPMHYLRHGLFVMLLREAEEEFGFRNEGVLKIPCTIDLFEKVCGWWNVKQMRIYLVRVVGGHQRTSCIMISVIVTNCDKICR